MMLGETWISLWNERQLRIRGAIEPVDDVYGMMRWAYPSAFVAMAVEGAVAGPAVPGLAFVIGAVVFVASKALKLWAIQSLGSRWTFRVLVLPAEPLVTSGPYALMRHPNYAAVVGELVGMALLVGARLSGPVAVVLFGLLLRRRSAVENRMLQSVAHPPSAKKP